MRLALVAAGIVLTQLILYGSSLVGQSVLLPVDLLAQPRWYLPQTAENAAIVPHNIVLADPILAIEIHRRFAASEIRAGRAPLWNPYNYTGTPMARWAPFSPWNLLYVFLPVPVGLAWIQLLKAMVTGLGAYLFFRRVLGVDFRAASIGAVAYPITGFFVLWLGYPLTDVAAWFPWTLLATDRAIRRPTGWGGPALALATAVVIWSGKIDVAGQVLLASGVYALWCLEDEYGWPPAVREASRSAAAAVGAWALGFLMVMPYLLPLGEYILSGARAAQRSGGIEERPPIGVAALPQTVLPDMYGSWVKNSYRIVQGNRQESSAAAFTGLVATLLLAPLAFCFRRYRSKAIGLSILALLGIGWTLNVPGLVQFLRSPGLNMMSHNRFVFVTSFAILSLAVIGLAWVGRGTLERRRWFWFLFVVLLLLGTWTFLHSVRLPEPIGTGLGQILAEGKPVLRIPDGPTLDRVQQSFARNYRRDAGLCLFAAMTWLALWLRFRRKPWLAWMLGAMTVGEMLYFAHGLAPQCDPKLYYPEVPVLSKLAAAPPGRVLGLDCLPPALNQRFRLREIRGHDGIDPPELVDLLDLAKDPDGTELSYAPTMWFRPRYVNLRDGGRLPPILDMLGIRYLIVRGVPPEGYQPWLVDDDYWVIENRRALPRVFVPRRVQEAASRGRRLELLAAKDFDPREIAYLEVPVDLPHEIRGAARIVDEVPTRIVVDLDMETSGLVVLSDLWFPGWKAAIDGKPTDVLRANHALRGVVASHGRSQLVFSYEPRSLVIGLRGMLAGLIGVGIWAGVLLRSRRDGA